MNELDQSALDAAEHRGQYLLPRELLTYVERFDESVNRGVPLDRLEAYAEALNERGVQSIDADQVAAAVEPDLTDAESWVDADAIYQVGDGLSAFPAQWHDELAGEEDLMRYVDVIAGDLRSDEKHTATGAAGGGVPQQLLLDAASALGPFSRDGVKAEIAQLQNEGRIEEGADQHPETRIWPAHE